MRRSVLMALVAAAVLLPVLAALVVHSLTSPRASRIASGPPPGKYRGSEPPPGIVAPDFTLRDYRGRMVRMRGLRGRVVVVTFLDTHCTTKCPVFATDIGAALRLLSPSERTQVVALALTVEPTRDTPRSVRRFLTRRHALTIDFLLGTPRQMRPIWDAFHVVAAETTGSSDVHSSDVRVFDRIGTWVSTLHVPVDLTPANLAHDIRVALRNGGGSANVVPDQPVHAATLKQRFAILSRHHSNKCGLRPESLDAISTNGRLQGSCCSPMNFAKYLRQVEGLKAYASVRNRRLSARGIAQVWDPENGCGGA